MLARSAHLQPESVPFQMKITEKESLGADDNFHVVKLESRTTEQVRCEKKLIIACVPLFSMISQSVLRVHHHTMQGY